MLLIELMTRDELQSWNILNAAWMKNTATKTIPRALRRALVLLKFTWPLGKCSKVAYQIGQRGRLTERLPRDEHQYGSHQEHRTKALEEIPEEFLESVRLGRRWCISPVFFLSASDLLIRETLGRRRAETTESLVSRDCMPFKRRELCAKSVSNEPRYSSELRLWTLGSDVFRLWQCRDILLFGLFDLIRPKRCSVRDIFMPHTSWVGW